MSDAMRKWGEACARLATAKADEQSAFGAVVRERDALLARRAPLGDQPAATSLDGPHDASGYVKPAASETPAVKHDRPTMFRCPECGPHAKADEDGCCVACGSDCAIVPRDDAAHPPASPPASPARSESTKRDDYFNAEQAWRSTPNVGANAIDRHRFVAGYLAGLRARDGGR